jgi:hypothetical protein
MVVQTSRLTNDKIDKLGCALKMSILMKQYAMAVLSMILSSLVCYVHFFCTKLIKSETSNPGKVVPHCGLDDEA